MSCGKEHKPSPRLVRHRLLERLRREFVRAALAHGFRVVVTAHNPKKLDELIAGHEGRAKALALDVTNAAQIKQAVSQDAAVW